MVNRASDIYSLKVSEIKGRVESRIAQISSKANESFKMLYNARINCANINRADEIYKTQGAEKTDFDTIIKNKAAEYSVNEGLIKAVIKAESGFNQSAVSSAGAIGLMQLMPKTAAGLGVTNPYDAEQNIDAGVRYLRGQIDRFGGNVKMALAAYNCGPNKLKSLGIDDLNEPNQFSRLPAETRNYVTSICKDLYE